MPSWRVVLGIDAQALRVLRGEGAEKALSEVGLLSLN